MRTTLQSYRLVAMGALAAFHLGLAPGSAVAGPGKAAGNPGNGPKACVHGKAQLERNKQTAIAYYEMAFNDGEPELAVELYVGIDENGQKVYTQHNPFAEDGPEAFIAFVNWVRSMNENMHINIVRAIAECDMVMTHGHLTLDPEDPEDLGSAAMDIFRFDNTGRIVEHWDVVQAVPENSMNDNGMF